MATGDLEGSGAADGLSTVAADADELLEQDDDEVHPADDTWSTGPAGSDAEAPGSPQKL